MLAVGQNPSPIREACEGHVKLTKWGDIEVDEECRTSDGQVFAAGDIALGPSSIIESVAQARKAATIMDRVLQA